MCMIVIGDVVAGFQFIGPFESYFHAKQYADDDGRILALGPLEGGYKIVDLTDPASTW